MDFKTIVRHKHGLNLSQFSKAIRIWCDNPQTINRRIFASVEIMDIKFSSNILEMFEHINALDMSLLGVDYQNDNIDSELLLDAVRIFNQGEGKSVDKAVRLYVVKLLPRVPHIFSAGIEFFLFNDEENRVINIHKPLCLHKQSLGPRFAYMLQHDEDGYTSVSAYQMDSPPRDSSIEWLEKMLFPRILKWAKSDIKSRTTHLPSVNLVSAEKYAELYWKMKEKYGAKLISNWPENTDPMKFVYEDIAIATYLLLLWEKERLERKTTDLQSFLDLGCGNGLLVYILFNEGHRGLGIDLRRRKIWDTYPAETPLEVCIDAFDARPLQR